MISFAALGNDNLILHRDRDRFHLTVLPNDFLAAQNLSPHMHPYAVRIAAAM